MHVELASEAHHESLADLLCELHAYYNEGSSVSKDLVRSYLLGTLLAPESPLKLVVAARRDGQVEGFAAVSLTYSLVEPSPAQRRQCWLKELYVRSGNRGGGVGRALMSWVARYAVDNGCGRMDWPVKESNTRGIAFYERLGAVRVVDRLNYRLSGEGLNRLAQR